MLNSYKSGIIILISNILASLLNGLLYRGKNVNSNLKFQYEKTNKCNLLQDSVYDSLISILMVGSYIVLSFIVLDILKNLHITTKLSIIICGVFNISNKHDVVVSVLNGIVEITRGIFDLSKTGASIELKTILASSMIGFGGFSIMLQGLNFLTQIKIPLKTILLQKTTQAILALIVSSVSTRLFLC